MHAHKNKETKTKINSNDVLNCLGTFRLRLQMLCLGFLHFCSWMILACNFLVLPCLILVLGYISITVLIHYLL